MNRYKHAEKSIRRERDKEREIERENWIFKNSMSLHKLQSKPDPTFLYENKEYIFNPILKAY